MTIINNNIDDFCEMIYTCVDHDIKDIRVFISETSAKRATQSSTPKTTFTYALFTPLYTAIYKDTIEDTEYHTIRESLKKCQNQCNDEFRIQVFENLFFESETNLLSVETEISTI